MTSRFVRVFLKDGTEIDGEEVASVELNYESFFPNTFESFLERRIKPKPIKVVEMQIIVSAFSSLTICYFRLDNGDEYFGCAKCHPNDDFDFAIGSKVALTRAVKSLSRSDRKIVWQHYFDNLTNQRKG